VSPSREGNLIPRFFVPAGEFFCSLYLAEKEKEKTRKKKKWKFGDGFT